DLWAVVAFALTSLVFLLIGFAIAVPSLVGAASGIVLGTIGVVVARGLMVYLPAALTRLWAGARRLPRGWTHVVFWSGLRGSAAPSEGPSRGSASAGTRGCARSPGKDSATI